LQARRVSPFDRRGPHPRRVLALPGFSRLDSVALSLLCGSPFGARFFLDGRPLDANSPPFLSVYVIPFFSERFLSPTLSSKHRVFFGGITGAPAVRVAKRVIPFVRLRSMVATS